MLMCMEKSCCELLLTQHGRCSLSCMQECMSNAECVRHVGVSMADLHYRIT